MSETATDDSSASSSGSDGDRNQPIRDLAKGAGVVYAGLVIEVLIAFLAQVLAARYLSTGGFGGITTGTALLNIGAIVGSLGLGQGLARYLPRLEESEKRSVVRTAFLVSLPVALLVGGALSLGAGFIATNVFGDPTVTVSVRIFGAVIPFSTATVLSVGVIRGQKQSRYRVYVENILQPVVRFSLVIVAVAYGLEQTGIAFAYAVPYAVGALAAVVFAFRILPRDGAKVDLSLFGEFARYSAPFVVTGAANFVYRSVDVFLVLYFLDSSAVGTYGVAYAGAQLMITFSAAYSFIGTPVASEVESTGDYDELLRVQNTVLRWLVVVSIPALAPLVFYPAEFIAIVYRPAYAAGALSMTVLACGFAVHNIVNAQTTLLEALGRSRVLAANNVVAAVVNVVLNVLLIPEFGIFGAAAATVVAYLTLDALTALELYHFLGRWSLTRRVLSPIAVAVPLFAAVWLLAPGTTSSFLYLFGFGLTLTVVFVGLVLAVFGLNEEEVMLARSAEERLGVSHPAVDRLIDRLS
ncbi:flippase [Halomarina oriensis]|uniref:Oligosaccharide flippase family protein n=1 Tax=Halomarina oriensis TaxID=671145 RepID=A0A6B0GDA9_9EURY|nr:flippase [Halomarina oriensis]MWG32896.1 oligosaccharide flippase family protein [Halomarina oriensis]